ncbi:lipocalin family protein [Pusillimonas sp. MFBS29]|uniref:lipocalin family protein n=1 Tax=Pusillimonas sp. MFBS29 TaxID=2886690 RepID=UPI001D10ED4B|nr:lipocalin family protein [Pusillimonas sp. MFBS29]MCC2597484.1 lipocalin family protein [Pusillimonas sp. MFBS29]
MKKIFAIPLVAIFAGCATSNTNLPTQAGVDLGKYVGTWYEQARLPNRFQKDCASDVQADYKLNTDNTISVTNRCQTQGGGTEVAEGAGRLSNSVDPRDPAILQVRFAPKWTSWLPMVWGDYWILRLEGDYRYSLVGTPDRKYLWVLSRDKQADQTTVDALLEYAETLGFPVDEVKKTAQ